MLYFVRNAAVSNQACIVRKSRIFIECAPVLVSEKPPEDCILTYAFLIKEICCIIPEAC